MNCNSVLTLCNLELSSNNLGIFNEARDEHNDNEIN